MTYGQTPERRDIEAAISAGIALAEPRELVEGHVLAYVVPAGASVKEVDIEKYLPAPTRKRGIYSFADARSFAAFVNREKTPETFILATKGDTPSFTAVFNGNEPENNVVNGEARPMPLDVGGAQPGWGDYRATYACPFSEEWKRWYENDGNKMSQADFAVFIEDNALDITQPEIAGGGKNTSFPTSADMVNVARSLEVKKDVGFKSAIRLSNGEVQFKYEEEISGATAVGTLNVPERFAVAIPVFQGTDPWLLVAKLRYRISGSGLTMWYDFERLFKVTERAFDEARKEIETNTAVPLFLGHKA